MIVEQAFRIGRPRDEVVAFLTDIDRASRCVPGVEDVQARGDNEYVATLRVRLGPVAAAFHGAVRVDDTQAPERLVAVGEGRDHRSGSQARVELGADLTEAGSETAVQVRTDLVIRGRLGQFGTGVINSTAQEMVREFTDCVNNTLSAQEPAGGQPPAATSRGPRPPSLARVVTRGVGMWLAGLLRSARRLYRRLPLSQRRK